MPTIIGLEDSTPLLDRPEDLRAVAEDQGYLFFKGLLPRDLVLELRRQELELLQRRGWLDTSFPLMEGRADLEAVAAIPKEEIQHAGVGCPPELYKDVQRLPLFHMLPHHPGLIAVYRALFGREVLPHPRNIARVMLPSPHNHPTPAHQDFIHIQGTRNVWTSWIPIGDCPRPRGNLTILPASHRDGIIPPRVAEGAGNLEVQLCGSNHTWIEHDFEAGDVLTFHSLLVHKSLPATEKGHVRLSCDYRFQPADEDIEEKSLRPHADILSWEEIYEKWEGLEDLRYYWKNHDLTFSPWDDSIRWQKERICD